jgi:hypothetical protein
VRNLPKHQLVGLLFAFFSLSFLSVSCNESSNNDDNTEPVLAWQTIPITMQMEAGVEEYYTHPNGGFTIHSGVGWMMPLGRASYVAGRGYDESAEMMPSYMWSDGETLNPSWGALFDTTLFCIYSLPDGDIYAWDGIMAGVQANDVDDGKIDYLLNVIVGGTGRYENANGILLGRTPGRGAEVPPDGSNTPFPLALPTSILKIMEGFINIEVEESELSESLPTIGSLNPQKWPEALAEFEAGNTIIPLNLEMEAGSAQWNDHGSGETTSAGLGWIEPFGRAEYHSGVGYDEDTPALRPDFMDDPSSPYAMDELCIYHLPEGDIYAYNAIVGNLALPTEDGRADYNLEIIVGGDGAFTGATGMLFGYTSGRGSEDFPESDGVTGPVPLSNPNIKIMEGYIIKYVAESVD